MPRKLHATKIGIPENSRVAVIGILNARLADGIDLATRMKQAHWNVKGPNFIALHELFDTVHGEVLGHVDDIAERVVALGGTAEGTAAVAVSNSTLPPYPDGIVDGPEHVGAVATALAGFGNAVRKAIEEVGEIGDAGTEDLFTAISRDIDKSLWLVEAHAQA